MRVEIIDSVEEFQRQASRWDDLWYRSAVTLPTLRAALVRQWIEQFAPRADIAIITIAKGDQLVAALPLIGQRIGRMLPCGAMPFSMWTPCGELLCDETQGELPLDALADAIKLLPWPVLWLECAALGQRRWRWFESALDRSGLAWQSNRSYLVDSIPIQNDWAATTQGWSKSHRKKMARAIRQMEESTSLQLRLVTDPSADEIPKLMQQAFQVEQSGWKGASGTSVLQNEGMEEFFIAQAKILAKNGHLAIAFLEREGEPIAFEYGWIAKRVYHSYKVGYDLRFAHLGPGQMLMYELLRHFSKRGEIDQFDCLGPSAASTRKWTSDQYAIDRMMIALPRATGSLALMAYRHAWPWVRRIRACL